MFSGMKMRKLLLGVILGLLAVAHSAPADNVTQIPVKPEDEVVKEALEDGYIVNEIHPNVLTTNPPRAPTTVEASQRPSDRPEDVEMEGSAARPIDDREPSVIAVMEKRDRNNSLILSRDNETDGDSETAPHNESASDARKESITESPTKSESGNESVLKSNESVLISDKESVMESGTKSFTESPTKSESGNDSVMESGKESESATESQLSTETPKERESDRALASGSEPPTESKSTTESTSKSGNNSVMESSTEIGSGLESPTESESTTESVSKSGKKSGMDLGTETGSGLESDAKSGIALGTESGSGLEFTAASTPSAEFDSETKSGSKKSRMFDSSKVQLIAEETHRDLLTESDSAKPVEAGKGSNTPGWMIIVGFIVGLAVLVTLCVAIATRDKWNAPPNAAKRDANRTSSSQQRELEMTTLVSKESPKENGKASEYTVIPLDELPDNYSSQ